MKKQQLFSGLMADKYCRFDQQMMGSTTDESLARCCKLIITLTQNGMKKGS